MYNIKPTDEDLKREGYVSKEGYKHLDHYFLKWFYSDTPEADDSFFIADKKNRHGATSRFHIFVSAEKDKVKKKQICILINTERQKDKPLFTKDIDFALEKLKDWCKDAPPDWIKNAEKCLGLIFRTQLRCFNVDSETEIGGGIEGGIKAGIPTTTGNIKVRHKKKKSIR